MTDAPLNARELGIRSRAAVAAKDRDAWLGLFTEDAVVQDPIGPSPLDPSGEGQRGKAAIAAFYDNVIASSEVTEFDMSQSYLCGDEVAEVGVIRITLAGGTHQAIVRGVYTYRTDGAGRIAALRTFWESDAMEIVEVGDSSSVESHPVRDGLFVDGEEPALLGTRCGACGSVHFPRADACTYCATEAPEPIALSRQGTLWAWTAVTAPPPGYRGEVPFGVGVVELPEGVRVITRLTESDPDALAAGQPMDLRIVPLHRDEDGNDVVTYAFAPL